MAKVTYAWTARMRNIVGGLGEADARSLFNDILKYFLAHPEFYVAATQKLGTYGYNPELNPDLQKALDFIGTLGYTLTDTEKLMVIEHALMAQRFGWSYYVAAMEA